MHRRGSDRDLRPSAAQSITENTTEGYSGGRGKKGVADGASKSTHLQYRPGVWRSPATASINYRTESLYFMKPNGRLPTPVSPARSETCAPLPLMPQSPGGERACECGWRRADNSTPPVFFRPSYPAVTPTHPLPPLVARTHEGASSRKRQGKREPERRAQRQSTIGVHMGRGVRGETPVSKSPFPDRRKKRH